LTLGLTGALSRRGLRVIPFKKGPDYIDAAWLTLAAGETCRNLDTFLTDRDQVLRSFLQAGRPPALSLVEGNRGLFDGMDAAGTHSTAELAGVLKSPLILVVDCTKSTRTVAALVLGCKAFDPGLPLAGVVLNRVAGRRQENLVRKTIEDRAGVPVVGAIPRIGNIRFLERHLGLVPPPEHPDVKEVLDITRETVENHVDLDAVVDMARAAVALDYVATGPDKEIEGKRVRIGIFRDAAFNFYYPENLEELERHGAHLVELNALADRELPPLDALYIGGGFPETHAEQLAANEEMRRSILNQVECGLPVYAECGGLTYLCESIRMGGIDHPMVGVFPIRFDIDPRPQGHGYCIMEVDRPNPFFDVGTTIKGHEFRYSRALDYPSESVKTAYRVERGRGLDGKREGLCFKNVLAAFCHIHALGVPSWAGAVVERAARFKRGETGG